MKLSVLIENSTFSPACFCQHGLSLWLETVGKKVLFDFGQTEDFLHNAKEMGIDVRQADACILSHGHYDHSGGLEAYLAFNKNARVYIRPQALGQFHSHKETRKYIGMAPGLKTSSRLIFTQGETDILPGMRLYPGDFAAPFPFSGGNLTMEKNGQDVQDDFAHEQYLLITEGEKRILVTGCAHRGAANLLHRFRPDVLIGGFHFSSMSEEELENNIRLLQQFPARYYTGHCTGENHYARLKEALGDRIQFLSSGKTFEI